MVNKKANNFAVRREFGRFPLMCYVIVNILIYFNNSQ